MPVTGVQTCALPICAKLIALTALDMAANPCYDRQAAAKLASLGAHVGAMTPEELAEWIGKII